MSSKGFSMLTDGDLICLDCGNLVNECECEPEDLECDLGYGDMGETDYDGDG